MRLEGKVAVVTGAATGIGQAIAVAYATEGAAVVVDYVGDAGAADESIRMLKGLNARALAVDADVSDAVQVQNLIAQSVAAFGKLDILVNNAGIEFKRPFLEF